jgi:hypothetical protein
VRLQLVKLVIEFGCRIKNRPCNMASLSDEFVRVPYIEHER